MVTANTTNNNNRNSINRSSINRNNHEMVKIDIPPSDDEKRNNLEDNHNNHQHQAELARHEEVRSLCDPCEEDLWTNGKIFKDKEMVIKHKIKEYVNSFTVHGLTKVFTGSKIESTFWATMLLAGILLSIVICHGLVSKFLKYGIYTEILFPSITFCENQLLIDTYFSYCGVAPRIRHENHSIVCEHRHHTIPENITSKNNVYWSNGLFNITKCETWGGKRCANSKYFRTLKHLNHSYITLNFNGDLHDIYSHVDIEFQFTKPASFDLAPVIIVIPHDHEIHELDITNKVDIEPRKSYEIKLDKTVVKRLPTPYPSNCTTSKKGDIFPGKYTRRSCIESHNYIEMYKHCGDTLDYIRQFIPKDIPKQYARNLTIRQAEVCIWLYGQGEVKISSDCAFPCNDLDLGIISTFHERDIQKKNNDSYYLSIQYQRVDTYKIMEEKELYSWDQMACEIGGLIGLVIGASVISMVEIVAYVCLCGARSLLRKR